MQSLVAQLDHGIRRYPDMDFSRQGSRTMKYAEFGVRTHQVARALQRDGIAVGDRVALWSRNDMLMLEVIYGVFRHGAMYVPLNARSSVAENLALLQRYECKLLFVQDGSVDLDVLKARLPHMTVVTLDGITGTYSEWLSKDTHPFPDRYVTAGDEAAIFSTSGTTGLPKGVVHTHFSFSYAAEALRDVLGLTGGVINLVVAPLTHVGGSSAWATAGLGSTQVICESAKPEAILDDIEKHKAELLFVTPTILYAMLDTPGVERRQLSSLKTLLYAGSPIHADRLRQAIGIFGHILVNFYSQSEVIYPISSLSKDDHRRISEGREDLLTSTGRATRWAEVGIAADDGTHLGAGESGEIVARSMAGMKCYLDNVEATRDARQGSWLRTGDVGRLNEEGYLWIVDRKKDMIISGGFNVYSAEVEAALMGHPTVAEAAVVGVADAKWGEAVKAFVVLRDGASLDVEALRSHCRDLLGGFKAPKFIEAIAEFPRSTTGKVLKRELRDKAASA